MGPQKTATIFILETTLHIIFAIALMVAILINAPQFWLRVVLIKIFRPCFIIRFYTFNLIKFSKNFPGIP